MTISTLSIRKPSISEINYFIALIISFWIPLDLKHLPIALIIWILTWIIEGNFKQKIRHLKENKYYLALPAYFILLLIGMLYTENIETGKIHLTEKLSFIFLPIVIFSANELIRKRTTDIFLAFIVGNIVASLICFILAFYHSISVVDSVIHFDPIIIKGSKSFFESVIYGGNYFFYSDFSYFQHPSYFAVYILTSILLLIYFIENKILRYKKILVACILFLALVFFFLSSRAGFLSLFIVLSIWSLRLIVKSKRLVLKILFSFITILLSISFLFNPRLKNLLKIVFTSQSTVSKNEGEYERIALFKSSYQIIKEHFWLGVGTGDVKDELMKQYQKSNLTSAKEQRLNSHNQFLETFCTLGVLGEFLLLFFFIRPLIFFRRNHFFIGTLIIVNVVINLLFESMFNRFAGIIFVSFIINILILSSLKNGN